MSGRLSLDAYMMGLAAMASMRATCQKRRVGAVLVRGKRVVATGYNGAPPGMVDCLQAGCLIVDDACVRTLHAEVNALLGATAQGDTLYTTHQPCLPCLKAALAHNPQMQIIYAVSCNDEARAAFVEEYGLGQERLAPGGRGVVKLPPQLRQIDVETWEETKKIFNGPGILL